MTCWNSFQDLDPSKYRENRIAALKRLSDPYPHKWDVNISIPFLIEKYKDIEAGAHLESESLGAGLEFRRVRLLHVFLCFCLRHFATAFSLHALLQDCVNSGPCQEQKNLWRKADVLRSFCRWSSGAGHVPSSTSRGWRF